MLIAFASTWRIRSRDVELLATSSSVWSFDISTPERMRAIFAARGRRIEHFLDELAKGIFQA